MAGKSNQDPLLKDRTCYGINLQDISSDSLEKINNLKIEWLMDTYRKMNRGKDFFIPYMDRLAGTDKLRGQILQGLTEKEIRDRWQPALNEFLEKRAMYLLYPDFTK